MNVQAVHAAEPVDFVFVVRGSEDYGVERKLLSLMGELTKRGFSIRVYTIGAGRFADQALAMGPITVVVDDNVPQRFVARGAMRLVGFLRSMSGSGKLTQRLRDDLRGHPAVRVVFCEHGLLLPIGRAARAAATPAFWLMPNLVSGDYPLDLNRRIYAWAFKQYRIMPIANSRATRESLGRAASAAQQIDLGVDPGRFAAAAEPAPSPFRVADGRPTFVVMARLVPEKGQQRLIEALVGDPSLTEVRLVVCGGPMGTPYAAALQALIRDSGAADRIRLLGSVSDPQSWYALADVVAGLRLDPEPFGLSIVEAMMAAKPVLVHASGGPADIVVDGVTGWHLHSMDHRSLVDGLKRVLSDRPRWAEMGRAGRERALERYTVATMTDGFLQAIAPVQPK